jgi:citrate synthase
MLLALLLSCCPALQVVDPSSHRLISRCSGLAIQATPEQQDAARAAADDMAAAVAALRGSAGLGRQQQDAPQAATAAAALNLPSSISVTEAFRLSSRPGAKFKIVLDFDGNILQGSQWNKVKGIDRIVTSPFDKDGNPSTFNAEEIAGVCVVLQ